MTNSFGEISEKVSTGGRLDFAESLSLFRHENLLELGQLANSMRHRVSGKRTYFNRNLHLNYSNICEANCDFCSFSRRVADSDGAYEMGIEECLKWIEQHYDPTMTEVHIVGGLNPTLPFSFYTDLLDAIGSSYPSLAIKAFSAVEIHYFSTKFGMSCRRVLERFCNSGLKSLPGGGAEIFTERVRREICPKKADASAWLEVHETAHALGIKTNCSMLYGTIETPEEIVDHLFQLRDLQDRTGGFSAFIPLAYHACNNRLPIEHSPTAAEDLRIIAISRLVLDNIDHVKAYWVLLGQKTAQMAQLFGSDDLDGTVSEERVCHMAGADTPNSLSVAELKRIIESVGCIPVERNTLYEPVDIQNVEVE